MSSTEGHIAFRGFRTWYRIVGEGEKAGKLPLLCLHGGPGFTHDYIESLEDMARTGRRVIFYDQLGAGNSDRPSDPEMWTVELFLDELRTIRDELALDRVHLFGSSWGGMLAMEYALTKPDGLASLVLASSPSSIPIWAEETRGYARSSRTTCDRRWTSTSRQKRPTILLTSTPRWSSTSGTSAEPNPGPTG